MVRYISVHLFIENCGQVWYKSSMRPFTVNIIQGVFLIVITAIFLSPPIVFARDLLVPKDHPTIQSAVDAAAPGDTVVISDGLYKENISVNKQITLRSAKNNYTNAVIEAREPGRAVIKAHDTSGVNVTGLTVRGSELYAIHSLKCNSCVFISNYVSGSYTGIYIEYSINNTVSNNVATKNTDGISLSFSNANKITDNKADWNLEKGVFLFSSHDNIITGNTTNSNYWNGITLMTAHRNQVKYNVSLQNSYAIVMSDDSIDNVFWRNRKMRRLFYLLPVFIVYLAMFIYYIEKKFFTYYYYARNEKKIGG